MKQADSSKKWGLCFLFVVILMSAIVCLSVYIIDPFLQFRVRDNQYFLSDYYVNAGLIRNYDYDTVIIGSCMMANYDLKKFDESLGVSAIKVGCSGLGPDGVVDYAVLSDHIGKAKNFYLNVDFLQFYNAEDQEEIAVDLQNEVDMNEYDYLLKDDLLSRLKYMFGYEVWFRYIPVDVGLTVYKTVTGNIPGGKLERRTNISHNGEWSDDYEYGKEIVMQSREGRTSNTVVFDESEKKAFLKTITANMDKYMESIHFTNGEYTFIFPPYSYLFWEDAKQRDIYDTYMDAKNYLIERIKQNGGTVFDFQEADVTYNLDYYKDTTHYNKLVNDYMIDCMAVGKYKK